MAERTPITKVTECGSCPLHEEWGQDSVKVFTYGKNFKLVEYREVPYRGELKHGGLVIVGESPGAEEVAEGSPFIGRSGKLSDSTLLECGIKPESVFYANSCRCLLRKDGLSQKKIKEVLNCCRPALERALKTLQPKLIVCYGDIAMQQVLRIKGISKHRGTFIFSKEFNCWVLPTFHPAFCLRDMKNMAFFRPDLERAFRFMSGEIVLDDDVNNNCSIDVIDTDSIRNILDDVSTKIVAVDTETQGLDWTDKNSVVISYSVSSDPNIGYNVWLLREALADETPDFYITWPRKGDKKKHKPTKVGVKKYPEYDRRIGELRELLESEKIIKVMMNGNYDLHRFRTLGIDRVNNYRMDIQLAFHSLDPDMYKGASLLDIQRAIAPETEDHKTAFSEAVDKADLLYYTNTHKDVIAEYAAKDAAVTLKCALRLSEMYKEYKHLVKYYRYLAHPVTTEVLLEIEKNGVMFDSSAIEEAKTEIASELLSKEIEFLGYVPKSLLQEYQDKLKKTCKDGKRDCLMTKRIFMKEVLFSKRGFDLPVVERTKTGDESTSRQTLTQILETLVPESTPAKALRVLLEWGPLNKLYTTYLKGFEASCKSDGRLHTNITKTLVATGRTSSRNPNLQNIPKRNKRVSAAIRRLLIAPPGKTLVAADYSQQELRWIAHRSGDREFIRVYQNDEDIHTRTALGLLGKRDSSEVDEVELANARRSAKSVNFGLAYGMSADGFMAYAYNEYGLKLTLNEAEQYRNTYFNIYNGLLPWHKREINDAKKVGYCTSPFGFMRRVPNINSDSNFTARSQDERIAINTPIQNAGSDSTLLAALKILRSSEFDRNRAKLVLFIHDELVFEVDDDYVKDFAVFLKRSMEDLVYDIKKYFGFTMAVPLRADVEVGKNLAEMRDLA